MFFWRKKAAAPAPRPAKRSDQKRQAYRASFEFPVAYVVEGRSGTRTAHAGDLSTGGLRLIGDEDLPDETIVTLRFTLPGHLIVGVELEKPVEPFGEMTLRAKTVIAFFNTRRRAFFHGVQFVDLDESTREELQRFIHVWQIRQLRERALQRD